VLVGWQPGTGLYRGRGRQAHFETIGRVRFGPSRRIRRCSLF